MSNLSHQATYAGPMLHKTERHNPTELIVRLMEKHPGADRQEIETMFIANVIDDHDYLMPCLKYFFFNAWTGLHPKPGKPSKTISRRASTAVSAIKKAIVIGELLMPNGKTVRKCTGFEMRRIGGRFSKFGTACAKIAKGRKIENAIPEKDLLKLWQQHK